MTKRMLESDVVELEIAIKKSHVMDSGDSAEFRTTSVQSLPTEMLQSIYLCLEPPEMLAFKFVSRTLYAATIKGNGDEFRDWQAETLFKVGATFACTAMMIRIESELSDDVKPEKLTCSRCYICIGHGEIMPQDVTGVDPSRLNGDDIIEGIEPNGFCDEHFKRRKLNRMCIQCIKIHGNIVRNRYHVHGKLRFFCRGRSCVRASGCKGRWHTASHAPRPRKLKKFWNSYRYLVLDNLQKHGVDPWTLCDTCFSDVCDRADEDVERYMKSL